MTYEGTVYRPPSEADSLLIQATIGCGWNKCTFCNMYKDEKFRIRSMEDVKKDLKEAAAYRDYYKRIFLCDGDALTLPIANLLEILAEIKMLFPNLEGVRTYASARDILRKSQDELNQLYRLGLDMMYIGVESGSDTVLKAVNKGITKQEMIDAAQRLHKAGIAQSVSIIAGLGGEELSREHITETADLLNKMQPQRIGLLVLHLGSEADLYDISTDPETGLTRPSPLQVLNEMKLLLENLELTDSFFSSRHVSNYINIVGKLPKEKAHMLSVINKFLDQLK